MFIPSRTQPSQTEEVAGRELFGLVPPRTCSYVHDCGMEEQIGSTEPPSVGRYPSFVVRVVSNQMTCQRTFVAASLSLESVTTMRASVGKPIAHFQYLCHVQRSGLLLQTKVFLLIIPYIMLYNETFACFSLFWYYQPY